MKTILWQTAVKCLEEGDIFFSSINNAMRAYQYCLNPELLTGAGTPNLRFAFTSCYAMLCYAKSLQLCLTLCSPINGSPPGSPVPGILQARTLAWVAISFSNIKV